MTDEQFEKLMNKLERIEYLLRGMDATAFYKIPQHLWTEYEVQAAAMAQRR